MSDYSIRHVDEVDDLFGNSYPGEMRPFTHALGCEQVAFSYRRMPQHTGGKGSYGHRHRTQEEVYFVIAGELQFKLGGEVIDVPAGTAVRVPPSTVRSVWNERLEDAQLLIFSTKSDEPDAEHVPNFWPK